MANLKKNNVRKAQAVEPIKSKKDLKKIHDYFKGSNSRNYALFVVGTNVLLRAGDLLSLKWSDVIEEDTMTFKRKTWITEEKTDKQREVRLNESCLNALKLYKDTLKDFDINDYIFKSRKGNEALSVKSLHRIIQDTCKELNIKGNFGTHSLRKTGAYHIYTNNVAENPAILAYLQKILNHSSQDITLRYIGIEAQQIDDLFDSLDLF